VNICDVDRAAVERLVAAGATAKATPREVASASDVVLMSLPHPDVSKKVALGPEGLVHGMAPGTIVVGLSTDGIDAVREIEAGLKVKGVRFVDCPVGKGPPAAAAGELTLFASGEREACRAVEPVLAMIGSKIYYCGLLGAGQAIKLANNLLSCAARSTTAACSAPARRSSSPTTCSPAATER
jgi:3-hydroxyisobutyrate dehydrogenase-like beta-hydroxyacid dehydrogenase